MELMIFRARATRGLGTSLSQRSTFQNAIGCQWLALAGKSTGHAMLDAQKVPGSHPPTPARQDAPFRRQGRREIGD